MRTFVTLRVALMVLGIVLGVVLLSGGQVVLGAIVLALAILRALLLLTAIRRRDRLGRRAGGRGAGPRGRR